MNAFNMKILPSLLIFVVMTYSVKAEKHENKIGRTIDTESNTKDVSDPVSRTTRTHAGTQTESNPKTHAGTQTVSIPTTQAGTQTERVVTYTFTPNRPCYTQFFVNGQPPEGLRQINDGNIRSICQPPRPHQTPQQTYYATMFDERYGIAVYSAYKISQANINFLPFKKVVERTYWCETPGIEIQGSRTMYKEQLDKLFSKNPWKVKDTKYDRGHLAPAALFSTTLERYLSTFTYTNTVPQDPDFNQVQWNKLEDLIQNYATKECINFNQGTLYLLTGTSFSDNLGNKLKIKKLVRSQPQPVINIDIPNSLWTAGCCVYGDGITTESFAVIGNNVQTPNLKSIPLADLQKILFADVTANGLAVGGTQVKLFPGLGDSCLTNDAQLPITF